MSCSVLSKPSRDLSLTPFLVLQVMRIRDTLSAEFSRLCYYGFWYAPEMELVMNSIDFSQRHVTGAVEIKLYKGNCIVMGRESPVALYRYQAQGLSPPFLSLYRLHLSPHTNTSLYPPSLPPLSSDLASMDIEDGGAGLEYNPMDAQGFIRINAVRLRANYLIRAHGSK
jgi:argininosuccinate synthase